MHEQRILIANGGSGWPCFSEAKKLRMRNLLEDV